MEMSGPQRASTFVESNGWHRTKVRPIGSRRIGVIGTGYVGLVTGSCLAELGNPVICVDNDASKIELLRRGEVPFFEPLLAELTVRNIREGRLAFSQDIEAAIRDSQILFIAVGTPMLPDEHADLTAISDVAMAIGSAINGPKIIVVKSTAPVETCELVAALIAETAAEPHVFDVVSNPEFLREGSAVSDFMYPDRIIIGAESAGAEAAMRELYAPLNSPILVTDRRSSEMVKYASNAFLATKISFINEIANICELVNVDIKSVAEGIGLDPRIGSRFMSPGIGYGGSCFPKDVLALERVAHGQDYEAVLLRSVDSINRAQIGRAFTKLESALGGSLYGKRVCVLGVAFKPNTSDVREAPALYLIEWLIASQATVSVHDPAALANARITLGDAVSYETDVYEAIAGCDAVVLATEWDLYKTIDFQVAARSMRGKIVFDGRNAFDPDDVVGAGLRYIGVGRSKEPVPPRLQNSEQALTG